MGSRGMVAASVLLLLTACGSGGESRVGGAEPTTETSEVEASPSSTPSEPGATDGSTPGGSSGEPSPDGPSVAPADGPVLRTSEGISIRVPRGFDADSQGSPDEPRISVNESDLSSITLSAREQIGSPTYEDFKRIDLESSESSLGLRVQPDRELLGQPAYHFVGSFNPYQRVDHFGAQVDGVAISIKFQLLKTLTRAQRAEIVEPVLASIQVG